MGLLLKCVVTGIFIGLIVWQLGDPGEVIEVMRGMDPWYALLVVAMNTADRALMTFKWARLLRGRGLHLPFLQGMKIYCASMIWGIFLPSTMGADAIRAFSTSRTGLDTNEVVASIVIERMVGFLSALLLGLLSLLLLSLLGGLDARFRFVWWAGILTMTGGVVLFAASFSRRAFDLLHDSLLRRFRDTSVVRRLRQFHSTYLTYQDNKTDLAAFFGLTFVEQLIPILNMWLIAQGLGVEVGFLYVAGAVPLAILISRIPVSINGLGVFEGVFVVVMALAGVPAAEALAVSLVGHILQVLSWLPWWCAQVADGGDLRLPRPLVGRN
ncbi:MAG: lysylphosphatidylglycerol synthase transmembrane domain-containing protein [Thermodesulfobacteriota bacterium]|jgi:uncharacterized protein (TIRG00374 family)